MTNLTLALLFSSASQTYQLPPNLLESLCWVESKHKVEAVHIDDGGSPSVGICQLKLKTAKWFGFKGTEQELMSSSENINYAAKYLAYQIKRYDGNVERAVVAYNRGNAIGLTRSDYSDKVMKRWEAKEIKESSK